jgi:peroxiredoxin
LDDALPTEWWTVQPCFPEPLSCRRSHAYTNITRTKATAIALNNETTMGPAGHLVPRGQVPDLALPLAGGGHWRLSDQKPKHFTMLAFYRGEHCSACRDYLGSLQSMYAEFSARGVTPIAISMDTAERACAAESGWGLRDLCVAYGLSLTQARAWGLYVSRGAGASSQGIEEPPMFVEPALFLVRPDRTLYYASIQSMPFGRPCFNEMLQGIEKAVARNSPARGEVAD